MTTHYIDMSQFSCIKVATLTLTLLYNTNGNCIFYLFIYLFSFATRAGSPQAHHVFHFPCNSVSQLLWTRINYPTLSTFPVGGNRSTRRKPTTFGRALTLLFSHEDWVRVHLSGDRTRNLRGERRVV